MAEAEGEVSVLGDVVERLTTKCPDLATTTTTTTINSGGKMNAMESLCSMRPIQAVIGRPFPLPLSDHFYGHCTLGKSNRRGEMAAASATGCTAHIQPGLDNRYETIEADLNRGTSAITTMARQHQWDPKDLEYLERGYYVVSPHSSGHAGEEAFASSEVPQGEVYLDLLLRFLRSTVRKHRELATAALQVRLSVDARMRERCAFGPDCAQLVHLIIMELVSGHTVPCSAAAECLILLFYDATAVVIEAVSELGTPLTDPETSKGEMVSQSGNKGHATPDTTFAELSELMRSGEERSCALENLGLTTAVMDALGPLLPPVLAARVLLGSAVLSQPDVAIRVASDPRYARFVTERLSGVLLGVTTLGEVAEELLLLHRVLHVRQACSVLLPHLHETFVLFLRYACGAEMQSVQDMLACLAASLVLREFVRHGHLGLFYDISDTLLSSGGVGAYVSAEMYLLLTAAENHLRHRTFSAKAIASELARGALKAVTTRILTVESSVTGETSAGSCVDLLIALSSMHYLATYFMVSGASGEAQSLLGSPSETRCGVQKLLLQSVLTREGLERAFLRLSGARCGGISSPTASVSGLATSLHISAFVEACWASLTHARARLIAAADLIFFEEHWEAPLEYTADMAIRFEQKCVGLTNVMGSLFPDELCTMVEIVHFMRRRTHSVTDDNLDNYDNSTRKQEKQLQRGRQYGKETRIAALFLLHSIALTKHGLDAAPSVIRTVLGLPDDAELSATASTTPSTITSNTKATPHALVELGFSLRRAVSQIQWPWFLFPLYDDELTSKSAWCGWVLQSLRIHQHMRDILQWDMILCHALKWAVAHCQIQQDWDVADKSTRTRQSELLDMIGELCGGVLPRAGGIISDSASDTIKALAACAAPHAEETMDRRIFESLAVTATACMPSTAVAVARLLSHTILEDDVDQCDRPSIAASVYATPVAGDENGVVVVSSVSGEGMLWRWAATGLLGDDVSLHGAVKWDLENLLELFRVVIPQHEAISRGTGNGGNILLRCLVEGFTRVYLRQHQPLTAFERRVLCQTIEEVAWSPACLREALGDSREEPNN